jgi:NitT/TauT family transport system ATP-binding protein
MIKISGCRISKSYQADEFPIEVLQDVSFAISEGEFVCLVGPSGCGKTTLLKLIAALQMPTVGTITVKNGNSENGVFQCAMVFQDHGLFPWMTILDNAAYGLEMQGVKRQERQQLAQSWLLQHGLSDFTYHYPHQLSGGMRQRVAIARAFLSNPEVLLMDEPFGALDAQTRMILQQELLHLWSEEKKTVVYVTHDIEEAILLGDRVFVMSSRPGRIREEIQIPISRPRTLPFLDNKLVGEIKWNIWRMLEEEVRQTLRVKD